MIELTKMNGDIFYLNPNLIEMSEKTPDTLITMMSGKKYYVLESVETLTEKIMEFYINVFSAGRKTKKTQQK